MFTDSHCVSNYLLQLNTLQNCIVHFLISVARPRSDLGVFVFSVQGKPVVKVVSVMLRKIDPLIYFFLFLKSYSSQVIKYGDAFRLGQTSEIQFIRFVHA